MEEITPKIKPDLFEKVASRTLKDKSRSKNIKDIVSNIVKEY